MTWEDPVILRDTSYNSLYSSQWSQWVDTIQQVYDEAGRLFTLQETPMAFHREISPGLFESGYDDGSSLIVNYNKTGVQYAGRSVGAQSFLLLPPRGGSRP